MIFSVLQILESLEEPHGNFRTLADVELCRDTHGMPVCMAGNSALVAKVRIGERTCKLRCYTRPKRNLAAIYRDRFLPEELSVGGSFTDCTASRCCDVVVEEWIDGVGLQRAVDEAAGNGDREGLRHIAAAFDRFALGMLGESWAHGDMKPDNLILDTCGEIHAIDFDAVYLPEFTAADCEECGTRSFQHPSRSMSVFDKSVDDYPLALISTALHALALEPSLYRYCRECDGFIVEPAKAIGGRDGKVDMLERLFAEQGDAVHFRMVRLLCSRDNHLPKLRQLLEYSAGETLRSNMTPLLAESEGWWGYRDSEGFVIPPLYDSGFEFSEGMAAVSIGGCHHFIDTQGNTVLANVGNGVIRPFRNGVATVIRGDRRTGIDRNGNEVAF